MPSNVIEALLARFRTSSEPSQPEPSLWESHLASPMEVHIVDKQDIFYKKGRVLAEQAYRRTWNTENLIDGNDFAVVVSQKGKVIGNINIQLRYKENFLKSEKFFGKEHWNHYFNPSSDSVAEISALAIAEDIPSDLSRPIMMMLILGILSLCRLKGISLLITVQHEFLIRILKQGLHLPFIRNEQIKRPQGEVPNDDYWNQKTSPRLYYIEPNSYPVVETSFSYFCYLNTAGISTVFYPRIQQKEQLTYSAFRKSYSSEQQKLDLAV